MLWLNGNTVLSTERRALSNEILRSKGVTVIELPAEQIQEVFQGSKSKISPEKSSSSIDTVTVDSADTRTYFACFAQNAKWLLKYLAQPRGL